MATKKLRVWTGDEDRARIAIVAGMERVKWADVAERLVEEGFPERTTKSVRNRHLRWRTFEEARRTGALGRGTNRCRTCGLDMRGHVCGGVNGPNAANVAECVVVGGSD
jgi:hypothetical protein